MQSVKVTVHIENGKRAKLLWLKLFALIFTFLFLNLGVFVHTSLAHVAMSLRLLFWDRILSVHFIWDIFCIKPKSLHLVNFSLLSRYFAFTTFFLLFRFLFSFVYLFLPNSDRVIFPSSQAFSSFFHYISYAFATSLSDWSSSSDNSTRKAGHNDFNLRTISLRWIF